MQSQVVRARKAAVAVRATERLYARVLSEVPSQLIGASKLPGAALPGAFVRLLSCRGEERESGNTPAFISTGVGKPAVEKHSFQRGGGASSGEAFISTGGKKSQQWRSKVI